MKLLIVFLFLLFVITNCTPNTSNNTPPCKGKNCVATKPTKERNLPPLPPDDFPATARCKMEVRYKGADDQMVTIPNINLADPAIGAIKAVNPIDDVLKYEIVIDPAKYRPLQTGENTNYTYNCVAAGIKAFDWIDYGTCVQNKDKKLAARITVDVDYQSGSSKRGLSFSIENEFECKTRKLISSRSTYAHNPGLLDPGVRSPLYEKELCLYPLGDTSCRNNAPYENDDIRYLTVNAKNSPVLNNLLFSTFYKPNFHLMVKEVSFKARYTTPPPGYHNEQGCDGDDNLHIIFPVSDTSNLKAGERILTIGGMPHMVFEVPGVTKNGLSSISVPFKRFIGNRDSGGWFYFRACRPTTIKDLEILVY